MEVTVQLSLDSSNVQHEKLALRLVHPRIEGFSVEPTPSSDKPESEKKKKTPKRSVPPAIVVVADDVKEAAKKRRKR